MKWPPLVEQITFTASLIAAAAVLPSACRDHLGDEALASDAGAVDADETGAADAQPTFVLTVNGQPATDLNLTQGGVGWISVSMSAPPVSPVAASVQLSQLGLVSAIPALMQFDATNYRVPQTLTIFAPKDNTATDKSVDLHVAAPGFADGVMHLAIKTTNVQSLLASPNILTITEGQHQTFTVRPAFAPAAPMTVNITSPDPSAATVSPSSLTFTAATFQTAQPVTVTGVPGTGVGDRSVDLSLTAQGLAPTPVSVTVVSTKTQGISVSPSSVNLTEGGAPGTFGVSLTQAPTSNVTVNVASGNEAAATVSPATLTFTPQNYNTAQNVTVTPVHDANTLDENVVVAVTSPGLTERDVSVFVKDVDVQALVTSTSSLSVNQGSTGTFTVNLAFDPGTPLTATLLSSNTAAATVNPTSLTFTSANYNQPQTVTVTGVVGTGTGNQTASIPISAPGVAVQTVNVTAVSSNVQSLVVNPTSVSVLDTGTAAVTAQLAFAPSATTTVSVASSDTTAVTVSPTKLTFTAANYNVAQTVTLTGVSAATAANRTANVSFTSTGIPTATVGVTVTSSAAVNLTTSKSTLTMTETGTPGTFTVALTAAPTANVTVAVASSNPAAATVSPAALTFTPSNYATPQTVTVTPVHDNNSVTDTSNVTLSATGLATQTVSVTVTDVDTQAIVPSPTSVTLAAGSTGTFTVKLAFAPVGTATVSLTSSNTAAVSVSPASLSFTSSNYATPQTVTLTAPASTTASTATITMSSTGIPNATVSATTTVQAPTCDAPAALPSPSSGHHNPGLNCIVSGCHTIPQGTHGPFTVAGTLYSSAGGGTAVSQATIHLVNANGQDVKLSTATNGNFFTDQAVTFPLTVRASLCPNTDQSMTGTVSSTGGSCNGCHASGSNQGRIHLP